MSKLDSIFNEIESIAVMGNLLFDAHDFSLARQKQQRILLLDNELYIGTVYVVDTPKDACHELFLNWRVDSDKVKRSFDIDKMLTKNELLEAINYILLGDDVWR